MKRDLILFIEDIKQSIENIEEFSKGLTEDKYLNSKLQRRAIERELGIIGEAVKNLPLSFREKYPSIPWRDIAGFRNILSHVYFGLIDDRVWKIIKNELPNLKKEINKILEKEPINHQ